MLCIYSLYMHKRKGRESRFDVIDLDPYGTATPFLDAAVQAVKPQGLHKFANSIYRPHSKLTTPF